MIPPANRYDLGDKVHVTAAFTNLAGTAFDPDVVKLSYGNPDGVVTTLVYGSDAGLVKDSSGNYHVDIDANAAGQWYYRWWSTGTGQAAKEKTFIVKEAHAVE